MSKTILFKTSTHTAPNCETHAYNSNFYIKKDYPMFTVKRSGYIILSCIKPQHWMSYKLFANVSWFCCVRGNFHRPCVLHPACVLVRVLRSVDLWCLRSPFLSLFHIYQAKAAAYFREAHAEVNRTILTVSILMQGISPRIRRDSPEAGQEDKLFGGLVFSRGPIFEERWESWGLGW